MDILKIFKLHTSEYNVLIQGTTIEPLFLASDIANILEIKKIRNSIQNFTNEEKIISPVKTNGGIQNMLFLTKRGLYKLINRSNKEIAKTFQNWVGNVIEEIEKNGKYELQNNEIDEALKKRIINQSNHESMIQLFDKVNVVYLGKVGEDEDGSMYVKIGCSDDIKTRSSSLFGQFGEFTLLKIIKCNANHKFEKFLHHHKEISIYNVKNYKNTNSKEIFKFTDESYQKLLNIIQVNVNKYMHFEDQNKIELEKINIENKKIDKMAEIKKLKLELEEKRRVDEMEERRRIIELREQRRKDELEEKKREHEMKQQLIEIEKKKIELLSQNIQSNNFDILNQLNNFSNSLYHQLGNLQINKKDCIMEPSNCKLDEVDIEDHQLESIENDEIDDSRCYFLDSKKSPKKVDNISNDKKQEDHKYDMNTNNVKELLFSKNRTNTKSPKVQQYDPETFEYITTFDSIIDTVRYFREEYNVDNFSDSTLRAAARGNYIYCGFRWYLIERDVEDIPYKIPPTEIIFSSRRDLVARINLDKNRILEVYPSQKEASIAMKLKSPASLCNAIKNDTLSQGHYWNFYDDCNEELKNNFIESGGFVPEIQKPISRAKPIQQIHPYTKEVLETFDTIKEIQLKFKMSRDSLKKAIQNQTPHNGFYWAYA